MPRLEEIHTNLLDRLQEAKEQAWLGEVAAIEASLAAAEQKLAAMRDIGARHSTVHLGMPAFRTAAGRLTPEPTKEERILIWPWMGIWPVQRQCRSFRHVRHVTQEMFRS